MSTTLQEAETMATDDAESLAEQIAWTEDKLQSRIDQTILPRIEALEAASDDAREERAELQQAVSDLQQTVAMMESRLDSLAGLAEDQETNPEKRVQDLREAMIRRAEAREQNEADGYPRIKMWWREIQDLFADYGHGEISKPDCYKAMTEAAEAPGFEESSKYNEHGNNVKAIRLDLDVLRTETGSSDPTTSHTTANAQDCPQNGTNATMVD